MQLIQQHLEQVVTVHLHQSQEQQLFVLVVVGEEIHVIQEQQVKVVLVGVQQV